MSNQLIPLTLPRPNDNETEIARLRRIIRETAQLRHIIEQQNNLINEQQKLIISLHGSSTAIQWKQEASRNKVI